MSELDFACMQFSIALCNKQAIERKELREKNAELVAKELWLEMAKQSSQKKNQSCKIRNLHYAK